jgi:hypothetical protein
MSTETRKGKSPGKAIYQLIVEAQNNEKRDRRVEVRFAFFRPVSVHTHDGHAFSAFSREISASGVGLIHNMPLERGEVQITISHEHGYSIRVRTEIMWCQSCGEGWYISGGRFAGEASVG